MDTIQIPLQYPIEANGTTLTALTLRRPKLKDLKAMDRVEGQLAKMAALIAQLGGLPPSTVDSIDAEDWMKVAEVLGGFFGVSPIPGKT